jgi:hypothetical protein
MLVVLYLGMSGDDTAAENWDHIGAKFVWSKFPGKNVTQH